MTGGIRLHISNERLSEMQLAAIGEISNQIAGRAITLLSDLDLHCDITPPAVLAAPQLQSLVPDLAESFPADRLGSFRQRSRSSSGSSNWNTPIRLKKLVDKPQILDVDSAWFHTS